MLNESYSAPYGDRFVLEPLPDVSQHHHHGGAGVVGQGEHQQQDTQCGGNDR